jgi:hypothetical protein
MARTLNILFRFPPIQGVFDTGCGAIYIFGDVSEVEVESIIVHETLHYVLLKVAGKKACMKLDKIYARLDEA